MAEIEVVDSGLDSEQLSQLMRSVLTGLWHEYADAAVSLVQVSAMEITPVSRYVTAQRLERAARVIAAYDRAGLTAFAPAYVHSSEGVWMMFPPAVEASGQGRFLLDGTHRVMAISQLDRLPLVMQMSRAFFGPLPCSPTTWGGYTLVDHQPTLAENLADLDLRYFRPLTTYFNSLRFDDLAAARRYVRNLLKEAGDGCRG